MKIFSLMYIPNDIICMGFIPAGYMETNVKPASIYTEIIET
jgi:hypothetical protein